MSNPAQHHKISYIEFTTTDIERTKQFYSTVFGWSFKDWGPEYVSFAGAGIDGGFAKGETPAKSSPLDLRINESILKVMPKFEESMAGLLTATELVEINDATTGKKKIVKQDDKTTQLEACRIVKDIIVAKQPKGPLIVLYSANLEATEAAIVAADGSIVVPTFEFPGGRRFHFSDGAGNLLGVWSE
ncbi:MAG: VOC family protein [Terracidiphilus sp.]|jgi:predicted enzyme related to lactoylglutathione lyase